MFKMVILLIKIVIIKKMCSSAVNNDFNFTNNRLKINNYPEILDLRKNAARITLPVHPPFITVKVFQKILLAPLEIREIPGIAIFIALPFTSKQAVTRKGKIYCENS